MAKRRGKIRVATLFGMAMTAKQLIDEYRSAPADLRGPAMTLKMTGIITPGYETRLGYDQGEWFDYKQPLGTWAPTAGGYLISKYVGGKDKNGNGLNLNGTMLKDIPIFGI